MILINLIQVVLLGLWTLIFVYVISLLLPSKVALWLTVYLWSPLMAVFAMSRIRSEGREKLDPNKSYIFMANHASYFDIPCIFWGSRRMLHFLAKEELKHNIFTGFALRKLQMVFIERGNAQKSASSMRHVVEMTQKGMDIAIFPEGTRTRTGELGVFKKGGFKLAINSQVDVVPVTIKHSAEAWSRSNLRFRPTTVIVHFSEPVSVQGLQESDAPQLASKVADIIKTELEKA
ncbi:MAG: 1-acyl-sn-glycerol-3-phosphate acyltransferase [Bacteroidales bacterium]|nr:1-acyl-sn-glycerol-3-phosphate acyltransferase [Bacteroidales bacterium]